MEGGSPLLEYVTYAIVGIVLCALGVLALRTAWFFLSLLAIPLTEAASRWRPTARIVRRWGERGVSREYGTPNGAVTQAPLDEMRRPQVPLAVRRGLAWGAALGTLPGVWLAVHGAMQARAADASSGEIAAAVGMGLGLVAAAGALAGGAVGALAGLAREAWRTRA
jgi:hypothetical protein